MKRMKVSLLVLLLSLCSVSCSGFKSDEPATSVQTPRKFSQVKTSGTDTCAMDENGYLYCWGSIMYHQHGTGDGGGGTAIKYNTRPTLAFGGLKVSDFDTNGFTACVIDAVTSELKCSGYNYEGQLGTGTKNSYVAAITKPSGNPAGSRIRLGGTMNLSMVCLNYEWDDARCWASSLSGDGTNTERLTPTWVTSIDGFTQLGVGGKYACGLISGGLFCWGAGIFGNGNFYTYQTPTAINSGTYDFLSVGGSHSCGITTAGVLKCWGNRYGDGVNSVKYTATALDVGTTYRFVSAGWDHTCAITTDDQLKCWGENDYGQLGDGTNITRGTPKIIDAVTSYRSVSVGSATTCGITLANNLKCWGANNRGQIGDGTTTDRLVPTLIY